MKNKLWHGWWLPRLICFPSRVVGDPCILPRTQCGVFLLSTQYLKIPRRVEEGVSGMNVLHRRIHDCIWKAYAASNHSSLGRTELPALPTIVTFAVCIGPEEFERQSSISLVGVRSLPFLLPNYGMLWNYLYQDYRPPSYQL